VYDVVLLYAVYAGRVARELIAFIASWSLIERFLSLAGSSATWNSLHVAKDSRPITVISVCRDAILESIRHESD